MRKRLAGVGAAAVLAVVAAGCGGAGAAQSQAAPDVSGIRQALVSRLNAKHLFFRWVACVPNGRTFKGLSVVRCNVNFGDPHIEAYCSVLDHGRLVTNHDNAALPCQHDDAGWKVVTS